MECFCHKLQTQTYHEVTETEAAILKRTWIEAAYLFQANPLTSPDTELPVIRARRKRSSSSSAYRAPKRQRTLPDSSSASTILLRSPDQSLQVTTQLSSSASDLVKTYSYQNAVKISGGGGLDIQQEDVVSNLFARIFLAIERSDENIEIQQLFRRTYCYGFALLHEKGTSINKIVQDIQNALPHDIQNIRQKVYRILRTGAKWVAIIEEFASILQLASHQPTGLLYLLGSPSTWERASTGDYRSALTHLSTTTDIRERTSELTPFVAGVLKQILLQHSFVDETCKFTPRPQSLISAMPMSQSNQNSLQPRAACARRALHTASEAYPAWKTPSLVAALEAASGSSGIQSEDAKILLVLLSFFSTSDEIPLDLLSRGVAPRKRWTAQGEIEEVDAIHTSLAPELRGLLLDSTRLENSFHILDLSSAVSKNHDQIYTLDKTVASRVRERLPAEDLSFWRCQALIVAYRAIPWKYIESAILNTKLFLPHLKHALQAFQGVYESLPASIRLDLALTLIEASRFPNMAWKRFAVGQAEIASRGLEDSYLDCRIAQSQSLLSRIGGNMDHAASSIGDLVEGRVESAMDKRMHSATGQATIQRSLNCIQVEDLSTAKGLLERWSPLDQDPSLIEQVIVFRRDMLLGRTLRFLGAFDESLTHLERARKTAEDCKDLIFDEDLRDLTCDHADTLRELNDPWAAEHQLRAEIARQDQHDVSPRKSLLELCLAEAMFAQRRFKEAEQLCLDIESRAGLLKLEKLRLHITMAKIRHVQSDNEGALSYWSGAMKEIGKFQLTNGRTTRIIVISICDTLSGLGHTWLMDKSLKQVASLDEMAKPGGTQYWIAGMRHWLEHLQSQSFRSHM